VQNKSTQSGESINIISSNLSEGGLLLYTMGGILISRNDKLELLFFQDNEGDAIEASAIVAWMRRFKHKEREIWSVGCSFSTTPVVRIQQLLTRARRKLARKKGLARKMA